MSVGQVKRDGLGEIMSAMNIDNQNEIQTENPSEEPDEELLEKREPAAPFALVGLSYMIILLVLVMTIAAYMFFGS